MNRRSVIGSLFTVALAPLGLRIIRESVDGSNVDACLSRRDGLERGGCWSDDELGGLSLEEHRRILAERQPGKYDDESDGEIYLSDVEYRARYGDEELSLLLAAEEEEANQDHRPAAGIDYSTFHPRYGRFGPPEAFWEVSEADLV
jgi:hypothetical protein